MESPISHLFRIRKSTLLGPILTTYLSMTVLQDLSITQLWNVLLRNHVKLLRLRSCLVLITDCWCCYLCDEPSSRLRDRTSFERYDRGIRLAMTVMPSVT